MAQGHVTNRTGKGQGKDTGQAGRAIYCFPVGMEIRLLRISPESCCPDKRSPGSLHTDSHQPLDKAARGMEVPQFSSEAAALCYCNKLPGKEAQTLYQ